ncbi:MAG: ferritin family protein [Pseudobdellovibrionaceae bacterium]|jgi:rubrerythrin|nr:ferritin family protein [Pseudobdellovibrionaceae bacterium]
MKRITDLTEQEILALAITSEEEDSQIYMSFANRLRNDYPSTAQMFEDMAAEEQEHKNMLLDMFGKRFGGRLPYITRQDVRGFMKRNPIWLMENMRIDEVRQQAELMEIEASTYYSKAAQQAQDVDIRKLLGDLALAERGHEAKAIEIERKNISEAEREEEGEISKRLFVLQVVQPGLAGLIDGSVSTLAPIFAAAFATHNSHDAFLVGLAASLGAGISMGLTEAMSDDGAITGRGSPWLRGVVCGVMTAIGGLGHTLPYLISDFWTATLVAAVLVAIELIAISWIRWKYMDTPIVSAMVQVLLGGALVLLSGILIGSA